MLQSRNSPGPAAALSGSFQTVEPLDEQPIERLEAEIEAMARTIAWCRKFIIVSKVMMAMGALWLLAIATGFERFTPLALIFAITIAIAGIVGFGTNRSTAERAAERLEIAERLRSELIDRQRPEEVGSQ
jgi:hypothetical protein